MKIMRFSRLRDCGIFRDFTWPNDLTEFGRYNLVYGWNGTGKTTLSRVLRSLEQRQQPKNGQVTIRIGGKDIRGEDFPEATLPVRVFNRDFVNEVVFPVQRKDLPPIYVFGKESVENQKEVGRLKAERAEVAQQLKLAQEKKERAEKEFDQFCIDRARAIKENLRSPGFDNPYSNYDKSDFRKDAEKMASEGDAASHRLSDEEWDKLRAQHLAKPKQKVRELSYSVPSLDELAGSVSDLLEKTVVSAAIHSLKDDPELAEWTRHGLALHKERQSETCLFCQQSLPQSRIAELEAHFSAQYEKFIKTLDEQVQRLQTISKQASELKLPTRAELYDDLASDYEKAEKELRGTLEAVRNFVEKLIEALNDKKRKPCHSLQLDVPIPTDDAGVVDRLNEVIRSHNRACDEFETRVKDARDRLARGMIADYLDVFVQRQNAISEATNTVTLAQKEVQRLTGEIDRLEREIVEHRQPAEELNEDLQKYLGHKDLHLEVKDTGYVITRNGEPATALSEGEMTAIALLYFLKSLKDRSFDLAKGVVVLDDPVSSLDANALYLAFGFIRERTKNAGQLFIFTHNFGFLRQVRNWFDHLPGQKKKNVNQRPARSYMLDCDHNQGQRCARIRPLDPLLERYESEYHYLFARVYREANASTNIVLEENLILPNIARRLLEAFLAFRQPHLPRELWQKVSAIQFDEAKKIRILRFVHTYSHNDAIGEPEHDPSLLAEGRFVLKDLLEFIKSQDPEHYSAMEKLLAPRTDEGESE
ncbi:MAG: AAA family ATPase [Bacillota bacterium]